MFACDNSYPARPEELYPLLKQQLQALVAGVPYPVANLANASALLNQALTDINWVGFYLRQGENLLVLGPFQGKTACIEIPFGRGVCGTAAAKDETQLVTDVHQFPGHIACSSASNSEIVVPVFQGKKVIAVLDIDSTEFNTFDQTDKEWLEKIVSLIG